MHTHWVPLLQAKVAASASLEQDLSQLKEYSRNTETKLQVCSLPSPHMCLTCVTHITVWLQIRLYLYNLYLIL